VERATQFGEKLSRWSPQGRRRTSGGRRAASFEDNALLQLNILQTVVFSDHKSGLCSQEWRLVATAPAKAGGSHTQCAKNYRASRFVVRGSRFE
jgi:hypothetical protein